MEKDIEACARLPGVRGAFVCDNVGEVMATSNPPPLATDSLSRIAQEVVRSFAAMQVGGRPAQALQYDFQSWQLYAQDLGGSAVLIVVSEPDADRAMVRMTARVTAQQWRADKNAARQLAAWQKARTPLLARGQLDDRSARLWSAFAGA